MRRVYSAANLPEAYIVLDLLRAAGIDARVFNENAQGGLGEIPFTHAYPELWVMDDADVERARTVVTDYEHAPVRRNVFCRACGEQNPGSFQICWNCGEAL
jgi:hypothetical protein